MVPCPAEENSIRDKAGLPRIVKDMIDALAYGVMWTKVAFAEGERTAGSKDCVLTLECRLGSRVLTRRRPNLAKFPHLLKMSLSTRSSLAVVAIFQRAPRRAAQNHR